MVEWIGERAGERERGERWGENVGGGEKKEKKKKKKKKKKKGGWLREGKGVPLVSFYFF